MKGYSCKFYLCGDILEKLKEGQLRFLSIFLVGGDRFVLSGPKYHITVPRNNSKTFLIQTQGSWTWIKWELMCDTCMYISFIGQLVVLCTKNNNFHQKLLYIFCSLKIIINICKYYHLQIHVLCITQVPT